MLFSTSSDFFQNQLFRKILSGIPSECQTVWTQARPNVIGPGLDPNCLQRLSGDDTAGRCMALGELISKTVSVKEGVGGWEGVHVFNKYRPYWARIFQKIFFYNLFYSL